MSEPTRASNSSPASASYLGYPLSSFGSCNVCPNALAPTEFTFDSSLKFADFSAQALQLEKLTGKIGRRLARLWHCELRSTQRIRSDHVRDRSNSLIEQID
jgi:hypothetical protein